MKTSICYTFLLALFFSTPIVIQAQDRIVTKNDDGEYRYQAVHECPGVSADVLMKRIENWSKLKFDYYDFLEDPDSSQLKGYILKRGNYSLVIEAKNNKYRTSVLNVHIGGIPIERYDFKRMVLNVVDKDLKFLLPNLDNFLKNKDQLNKDNW